MHRVEAAITYTRGLQVINGRDERGEGRGDLWLILALLGVALLLGFCTWGIRFTPDMTQPPSPLVEALGTTALCGGLGVLGLAGLCFLFKM